MKERKFEKLNNGDEETERLVRWRKLASLVAAAASPSQEPGSMSFFLGSESVDSTNYGSKIFGKKQL